MAFTLILLCFFIQRWIPGEYQLFQKLSPYYPFGFPQYISWRHTNFLKKNADALMTILWILAVPLAYLFGTLLIYHLFGVLVYYFVILALLWHALDLRPLAKEKHGFTPETYLIHAYQRIFAVFFWFLVLGIFGVILYTIILDLEHRLSSKNPSIVNGPSVKSIHVFKMILDWVPLRLTGFTFALAGNFAETFRYWRQEFLPSAGANYQYLLESAKLGIPKIAFTTFSPELTRSINALILRSFFIWLTALTLFTIGNWIR